MGFLLFRAQLLRVTLRQGAAGTAIGLALALVASGGIAGERITRGAPGAALLANTGMTIAALFAVGWMMRRTRVAAGTREGASVGRWLTTATLASQLVGAAAGIALVHVALRHQATALPWLSERPAQLVNDAVAVLGILALVWACADGLDLRLLVLALAIVTAYRATSSMWHLDVAPGGFRISIQELVAAHMAGAALAMGLFRTAVARAAR